ncbi:MAG: hypothetical protein HY660_14055 [Armatimonadetes bacterium]|nr:hypothetical protein [Armatimonadota bacterium]
MVKRKRGAMPRKVAERVVDRCADKQVAVVVPTKDGRPGKVYELGSYLKMQNLPRETKPWSYRKQKPTPPDPLGAVDGKVLMPITRENIYE